MLRSSWQPVTRPRRRPAQGHPTLHRYRLCQQNQRRLFRPWQKLPLQLWLRLWPNCHNPPTAFATSVPGTPAAVPTPQSSAAQVVPTLNAYCRKGPGTSYDAITFLQTGSAYNVTGRISLNTWWQVQAPETSVAGWGTRLSPSKARWNRSRSCRRPPCPGYR